MPAMTKTAAPLLLASLAACASAPPEPGESETEFETRIASALFFDAAHLKAGQRVVYLVKRAGESQVQSYAWSCTAADADAAWVENKIPHQPLPVIYKSKLARDGKLLEQWVGESGTTEPLKIWPRQGAAAPEARIRRDSSDAQGSTKSDPDRITVGGQAYDCTRVTTTLAYPDGRKSTMINWFSKQVPFASDPAQGGLVRRQFGRLTMDLAVFDLQGARTDLQVPAK
jgi:hypothetical protein